MRGVLSSGQSCDLRALLGMLCDDNSNGRCSILDDWSERRVAGRWTKELSGGLVTGSTGHANPQFLLTVAQPTALFITLTQEQVGGGHVLHHVLFVEC